MPQPEWEALEREVRALAGRVASIERQVGLSAPAAPPEIFAQMSGAPVDLLFQSIAGTEAANRSFGVSLALLKEAQEAGEALKRGAMCADGEAGMNVMYFETGQGSALSANAHHGAGGLGVDQQTLEARAYGVARRFQPMLVNTVVGFIGPEYLYDGKQIVRAGLEDHFCGKLLGLPMG